MSKFYYEHNRVLDDMGWDVQPGSGSKFLMILLGVALVCAGLLYPYISRRNQMARQKAAVVYVQSDFGQGTGFFVSADGHLLTNHHVVVNKEGEKSKQVVIMRDPGTKEASGPLTADIVTVGSADPNAQEKGVVLGDWALLKLKDPPSELAFIPLARDEEFGEGDDVLALGFPLGFDRATSETGAKVSVKKGSLTRLDEDDSARLVRITHNSGLDVGMSGGPLVLVSTGSVIGINAMGTVESRADEDYALPVTSLPADVLNKF